MSDVAVIDHVELGLSRVAAQFRESPKFLAFLAALLSVSNQIESVFQVLFLLPSIDDMAGANLDVIGAIVGTSRKIDTVVTLSYFGFDDTGYYATCFGEEGNPGVGSRFYEEGETYLSTTVLQDPEFRVLIRAKIARNNSTGTDEDIINGIRILFGTQDVHLIDNYDMSLNLEIGRPLYATERALISALDILPRPAGVRLNTNIVSYEPPGEEYTGGDSPYGG